MEGGIWLHVTCCGNMGFLRRDEGEIWTNRETDDKGGFEGKRMHKSLAIVLEDQMEPSVLDPYDERTSAQGLLAVVQRPVAGVL